MYINTVDNIFCDALSRWEEVGSRNRIAAADGAGLLCCNHLFVWIPELKDLQNQMEQLGGAYYAKNSRLSRMVQVKKY